MAIQIYCKECRTANKLDADQCRKCGAFFGRDRSYRVDVSVKGKRITRMAPNLTLAREIETSTKADLLREEYDISRHKTKKVVTLDDLFENHFLPWAKQNKASWRDDERRYNRYLKSRFGCKALDQIGAFEIEKMKLDMKKAKNGQGRPFASATIKHALVQLKRLFNLAVRWSLHEGVNPCASIEMPKLDNKVTEFLSDEETERLLKILDSWPSKQTAAFIRFAMFSGCRRGELFKMQWADVDFDRKLLTLRAPKGGKTETLPLSDTALSAIADLPRRSEYIFPSGKGRMMGHFWKQWRQVRDAAKLPASFRFHGLRHSFASKLVSSGVDLYTVGRLLTHKQASTTQRYAHLSDEAMRRAAEKSGELLTAKNSKAIPIRKA